MINVIKCPGLKFGTFNIGISVYFCVVLCVKIGVTVLRLEKQVCWVPHNRHLLFLSPKVLK